MDPTDWLGAAILLAIVALLAMTQLPRHWHTPVGFLIAAFAGVPCLILVVLLSAHPVILAGGLFCCGLAATNRL